MTQTVGAALAAARDAIGAMDARALLCYVLECEPAHLIAHGDDPLDSDQARSLEKLVVRRAAGEPVAYLTGNREFHGLSFRVTPAVLIPRPETEVLVELALERIPRDQPATVLDLGTGSGCVAIAIAHHRPLARITATDAALHALAIARENARALGVANVEFAHGEWLHAIADRRFDLIVSNPPYVAAGDPHLTQGDLRLEPQAALVGGADGLNAIREIVAEAPRHLVPCGSLLFEHGHDQAGACRELLTRAGFGEIFSRRDLAGIERVSGGRRA